MSYDFVDSSSQHIAYTNPSTLDGFANMSAFICMKTTNKNNISGLQNKRTAHNDENSWSWGIDYTTPAGIHIQIGNGATSILAAYYFSISGLSANTWYRMGFSYNGTAGAGAKIVGYVDGSSQTTVLSDSAPDTGGSVGAGSADYRIGRVNDGATYEWDGNLCHAAVWSSELTAADHAALGNGISPLRVSPTTLVSYVPMETSAVDLITQLSPATETATLDAADHVPVLGLRQPIIVRSFAAAGGGITSTNLVGSAGRIAGVGGGLAG